jgi:hypothetical protein
MTEASMMQQQIRLGFRQQGMVALGRGTVNDGVAVFSGVGNDTIPPTRYPTTAFVTIAHSTANGSSWKFTRKGVYSFDFSMPMSLGTTVGVMVGGSLDCPAAQFLAAGVTPTAALTTMEDYDVSNGVANLQFALHLHFEVCITNTLRSSATAANLTPVGTVRIHIADDAGAVVDPASIDEQNALLVCSDLAELFG